jgi:hypothetical protein
MAISSIMALQVSVRSFRATVQGSMRGSESQVSLPLAQHYNSLLEKAAGFPELKEHLPPPMKLDDVDFKMLGIVQAQYTDLLVYLNQLLALTDLLEDGSHTAG